MIDKTSTSGSAAGSSTEPSRSPSPSQPRRLPDVRMGYMWVKMLTGAHRAVRMSPGDSHVVPMYNRGDSSPI
eukprot:6609099-Prymnesium_polylepis.1